MRTLAIHVGGLGDFILALPALERLAQDGPLELAGNRERLELAVAAGIAQAAHNTDTIDFSSVFSSPRERLRRFLQRFDRAIVWMRDDGVIASAFQDAGVGKVQCFPGLPPESWTRHAADYYAHCVGWEASPVPRLSLGEVSSKNEAVIHPGSGSAKKNWPFDRFLALADTLRERGLRIRWCLGPAEKGLQAPAQDDVLKELPLISLARELAQARICVGNDSGIAHLAAALGRRTVAIFGPTAPAQWGPRGPHVQVRQGDPWPSLAEAREAVWAILKD